MKTTIDIPDPLYRQVKAKCALLGKRIRDVTIELYRQWVAEQAGSRAEETPEEWLEQWVRLGEDLLRDTSPGPAATEVLVEGRKRLERS